MRDAMQHPVICSACDWYRVRVAVTEARARARARAQLKMS